MATVGRATEDHGVTGRAGRPGRSPETALASRSRLEAYVAAALRRCGVLPSDASVAAAILVLSDARGIPSHGVARLDQYVANLRAGLVTARPSVRVLRRRSASELWDADHGLGHPISVRAMRRAIGLARRGGIGLVAVGESTHFGIAGAYARQAMSADMIGIAMTNADPNVAATGSNRAAFGTNPIALGAHGVRHAFLLDMATSVVPAGRLEVARRRGVAIREGWAVEPDGRPTTDPDVLERGGVLLPLGGSGTELGGHKGFGLAAAVDLLTGVLGDTAWTTSVRSLYLSDTPGRVGHTLVAIDPAAFGSLDAFRERLDAWVDSVKSLPPSTPGGEVLVAGEPESRAEARNARTVPIDVTAARALEAVAVDLGLERQWSRVMVTAAEGRVEPSSS